MFFDVCRNSGYLNDFGIKPIPLYKKYDILQEVTYFENITVDINIG